MTAEKAVTVQKLIEMHSKAVKIAAIAAFDYLGNISPADFEERSTGPFELSTETGQDQLKSDGRPKPDMGASTAANRETGGIGHASDA